ncbi:alcohol oxidase-like protein [Mycena metata]|uniref:Alcohol oxidase-like protein n=1 Tax=Mycena metata TaxID=1033252 RepID=A0AAD7NVA8_9AGAR|nr:alcohol oxidase-like protein [Mycena metata]
MPTAYVLSFVAFVLSFVAHVHATVSTTVPISFPCAAYQPSTERGVTHSHPRFMAVRVLSLMFVVSAHALRRAVSTSAFPTLSIKDKKEHIQAGQYFTHLAPTNKTVQFTVAKPSKHLAGRSAIVSSGQFGNVGWSSRDLLPLLQKAETYEIDPKKPTHGSNGPLKVSFGSEISQLGKEFKETGAMFEKNRPESDECNAFDAESINKFYIMPKWISKDGRRSDIPHNYIYNNSSKKLFVFDGILVNRVIMEGGVAVGVEYQFDSRVHESVPQNIRVVKAHKLVVVAAGSMGSPLILERSGLGRKDVLEKAGVALVAEIPGVGENYQDHDSIYAPYIADPDLRTVNPLVRGDPATWGQALKEWEANGVGQLGANYIDGGIKIRPHPEELPELGPDFLKIWNSTLAKHTDKPLMWLSTVAGMLGDLSALPNLNFISSIALLPGFLSNPADIAALRWGYKKGRELVRRLPSFRGVFSPGHPQFPEGSDAALGETSPVALDAPKIVYSAEDDKAIDAFVREGVATTWHSVGTCAMKPFDQGGVVDSKLNLYGVKKLKVADLLVLCLPRGSKAPTI